MWLQVAMFVASMVVSQALQPKPQKPKAASAGDFEFPNPEDGTPKYVVFGDVWINSWSVIGTGNFRKEEIKQKQKSLFGSKKVTTGWRYLMSIHMGVCLAIDDLVEIKVGDKTVWTGQISNSNITTIEINQPTIFGGDESEGGIQGTLKVLKGALDQPVLSELTALYGDAPAYRGAVTMFYDGLICSNSAYPKAWAQRVRRTNCGWYNAKAAIWVGDGKICAMNPAHIIYESQTNVAWGRGFPTDMMDDSSFRAAADQLYNEGFGMCFAWKRQDSIDSFVQEVLEHIGAALYIDRTTGLRKLVLIRDTYDFNTLPFFDYSNGLLRIEEDANSSNDLVTNQTVVSYIDPISNEKRPARAENLAAIQQHGIIMQNKDYSGIPTADLAGRLAARDMKISQSSLKRFKLVFDRRAYALQPCSVFKIALPNRGIESIVLRAIRVEHDTITNGEITVSTVQDVFGLPATNFIKEQLSLHVPIDLTPRPVPLQRMFEVPYLHLLDDFTVEDLSRLNTSYVMPLATSPNAMHESFQMMMKIGATYNEVGSGGFVFASAISADIAKTNTAVVVALASLINQDVEIGQCALINDEILRIDAIDRLSNTLTLARGCADTVPAVHAEDDVLWIYANANVAEVELADQQSFALKLLTKTGTQVLSLEDALEMQYTSVLRHQRPYPPANVLFNDMQYPAAIEGTVTLTWQHRNRIDQGSNVIAYDDAYSALEPNVEYILELYDAADNLISSESLGQVETYVLDYSAVPTASCKVRLYTMRNGIESYQAIEHELSVSFNPPYNLQGVWDEDTQSIELTWDFD